MHINNKHERKLLLFLVAPLVYACTTSVGLTTPSPGTVNAN